MKFQMKRDCGEHHFDVGGKALILKPGDVIECDAKALGNAIDKFQQINTDEPPVNKYTVTDAGGGKFNVLHPATNEPINTVPLSKVAAEALAGKPVTDPQKPKDPPKSNPTKFIVKQSTPGWFDVIHPVTSEPINDKKLRQDEAEELAKQTVEEWDAAEAERLKQEQEDANNGGGH